MRRLPRPTLREPQLFLILAFVIGAFAGLAVVCFRVAIEWGRLWLLGSTLEPSPGRLLVTMPVAGLAIGLLVELLFPAARGSGVNQTKAAVYVYDGYISLRAVVGKFVTSALAIASGQSLGPEDPSLQIGAGIASGSGRTVGLSRSRLRLIAPLGAAAGLAGAFNSPITAVLFVIEEVLGTWSAVALGGIVLAAFSSVVVQHLYLGDQPLFRVPQYHLEHGAELAVYALLGLIGGLAALAFVRVVLVVRPRLRRMPWWARILQPAGAGLAIAIVAIWFPQVTGAGYEYIDQAMHDRYPWHILAVLAGLKILTTLTSYSAGTPGGLFAPTLFIGAMLGGSVCGATKVLFPDFAGSTGAYALIGMGTLFAGLLRAPITSVFMIIEVSGNYSIVLPLMVSNTIAYLVSRRYQREAIFDALAVEDGMLLPSMEQLREAPVYRVEDAMRPVPLACDREDRVERTLEGARVRGLDDVLVQVREGVWTLVSTGDLQRLVDDGKGELALGSVLALAAPLPTLYPDQALEVALQRLGDRPLLPVAHRADARRLVGVLAVADVLAVYRGRE